jgi:hypothetical protein
MKLNKTEPTYKGMMAGAVGGIIIFAIVGLFPSSFIGGVIGLSIVGYLFGVPVGTELLARAIVGMAMFLGVALTGLAFILVSSVIGWLIGYIGMSLKVRTVPKTA